MGWRQNPQRIAWIVVSINFFLCSLLGIGVPIGARNFALHATDRQVMHVTAMAGTVQIEAPGMNDPAAVNDRRPVAEGNRVVTKEIARALVTVAPDGAGEEVQATIQLFEETALRLEEARTPRFPWSQDPDRLTLTLERGRARIATGTSQGRDVQVSLKTPQATVSLGSGSFYVAIQGDETQVTARFGAAQVQAAGSEVTANGGERISVFTGRPPNLPVPAELNLVRNGTFEEDLAPAWREVAEVAAGLQPGRIEAQSLEQGQVVRFYRKSVDGVPNMVGIQQPINRDVQGYESLTLRLDVQLLYQSVPGGGYLNSEYPIMAEVQYTDIYGKDLSWHQGFYYQDLPHDSTWKPPTGEKVPYGVWYTYESPNLFDKLRDTRPARISSIRIYASGHDYESLVSDVALIAR